MSGLRIATSKTNPYYKPEGLYFNIANKLGKGIIAVVLCSSLVNYSCEVTVPNFKLSSLGSDGTRIWLSVK